MENYPISISVDKEIHHFEIGEYLHHNGESCKVKVEELLHLLADQIEAHHPHGINKDLDLTVDKEL